MPLKRRAAADRSADDTATKRPRNVTASHAPHSHSPSLLSSAAAATSSSSSTSLSPSADWAHLPAELLSLVASYAPFRVLLHVALVNHRLYELVVKPESISLSHNHSSLWNHYPPVEVAMHENVRLDARARETIDRTVHIGADRFGFKSRGIEFVCSLLSLLHQITTLRLAFHKHDRRGGVSSNDVTFAILSTLQRFTHLRSLAVEGVPRSARVPFFAALNSLPALTDLRFDGDWGWADVELTSSIHRLCSFQLDHLTITYPQLSILILDALTAVMPRLRSLTVTSDTYTAGPQGVGRHALSYTLHHMFPSLLHVTASSDWPLRQVSVSQPPPLSSFTVLGGQDIDLSHINTRTFHIFYTADHNQDSRRCHMRDMLARAPRMQQLAITDYNLKRTESDRATVIFPPPAAPSALSDLTYLEFINSLALADLSYLLDAASPPVFAAQLTHLALRVHWRNRAAAALLLPSLPTLYPSLTHVHVGVQGKLNNGPLTVCAEWDAAVETMRAAVGSAWCENVDDVVSCREDVAWRHTVGLPEGLWTPYAW